MRVVLLGMSSPSSIRSIRAFGWHRFDCPLPHHRQASRFAERSALSAFRIKALSISIQRSTAPESVKVFLGKIFSHQSPEYGLFQALVFRFSDRRLAPDLTCKDSWCILPMPSACKERQGGGEWLAATGL